MGREPPSRQRRVALAGVDVHLVIGVFAIAVKKKHEQRKRNGTIHRILLYISFYFIYFQVRRNPSHESDSTAGHPSRSLLISPTYFVTSTNSRDIVENVPHSREI